MTTELKKQNDLENIINFTMMLNTPPETSDVKKNPMVNNKEFIPIGVIERKLDEYYSGLWSTENFTYSVVANEIIGSIELKVFHPIAKTWLTRIGCGSAMIQTSSGMPAVVENKIKNTLVKDFPHLKAECIKNAAKSLGVVFGRNLNRSDSGDFEYIEDKANNFEEKQMLINDLISYFATDLKLSEAQKKLKIANAKKATIENLKKYIQHYENKTV